MEKRIVNKIDMTSYELLENDEYLVGYFSQKNPEKNGPNEDSLGLLVDEHCSILIVADGVGGAPHGEEASNFAVETVLKFAAQSIQKKEPVRNAIIDAIEKTNQQIIESHKGARTTLTVCEINNAILRSYHVGDSGVVVCGQKGLLKYKTVSQSPVGYAVECGLLDEKEALRHPDRNLVHNVVGDMTMNIVIGPYVTLAVNDTLLLATDGLFDNFMAEDLIDIIRKDTLPDVLEKLCDISKTIKDEKPPKSFLKYDDVSFIICRLNN